MADETEYQRTPIRAPRAAGTSLRLLTALAENRLTGAALAGTLLKNAGVADLRLSASAESLPLHPPPEPGPPVAAADGRSLVEGLPEPAVTGWRPQGIADYARAYRSGKTDPLQVAERVLEACRRSEAHDPPLRLFIAQREDDVREQARAAAERLRRGAPLGPLDGVPVAVKDEIDQRGYPTTVGTRFLGGEPVALDATAVARLRAAGATLIGKANMHEIGIGVTGINPHHGACRNPYDPARVTGGSSSGPAAAVAAGVCPLAVGADGGGSIRIPASLCGVVGLKPTYGRVSEAGAAPLCWSVAHVGPIAGSVRDAALGYALMAGVDPLDPNTHGQPPVELAGFGRTDCPGVRIGVYEPWLADAEPAVVEACRAALAALVRAGAAIVPVVLPELSLLRTVHLVTIVSEMAASQAEYRRAHRKHYGCDTRLNLALADRLHAADYVHAQRLRVRLSGHFQLALAGCDVLATPATGCTAPPVPKDALRTGESNLPLLERIMRFAPAANLAGLPALSVPAGYDPDGLPIGLQLMGRAWSEGLLLRLGAVVEAAVERRPPRWSADLLAG